MLIGRSMEEMFITYGETNKATLIELWAKSVKQEHKDQEYFQEAVFIFDEFFRSTQTAILNRKRYGIRLHKTCDTQDYLAYFRPVKNFVVDKNYLMTLKRFTEMIRDESAGHGERVASFARLIAEKAGCNSQQADRIERAAPFHDIGKVLLPNNILSKPCSLDFNEWSMVHLHTLIGASLLTCLGIDGMIINTALYHHEKCNGRGYHSLPIEDYDICINMIALADEYDTARRQMSYKQAKPHNQVVHEITQERSGSFFPEVMHVFMTFNRDFEEIFNEDEKRAKMA